MKEGGAGSGDPQNWALGTKKGWEKVATNYPRESSWPVDGNRQGTEWRPPQDLQQKPSERATQTLCESWDSAEAGPGTWGSREAFLEEWGLRIKRRLAVGQGEIKAGSGTGRGDSREALKPQRRSAGWWSKQGLNRSAGGKCGTQTHPTVAAPPTQTAACTVHLGGQSSRDEPCTPQPPGEGGGERRRKSF